MKNTMATYILGDAKKEPANKIAMTLWYRDAKKTTKNGKRSETFTVVTDHTLEKLKETVKEAILKL